MFDALVMMFESRGLRTSYLVEAKKPRALAVEIIIDVCAVQNGSH